MNTQAVETAEITVQYVNDPKPGKKWGSIKASDGTYYSGPPAILKQFQPGESCKIEYTLGGNDGTLKAIKHKFTQAPALQRPVPPPMRGRTNPTDSEQIFVCALLKEIITPQMTADQIVERINDYRRVYRKTFGGSEAQRDDGMNDEIPEF